MQLEYANVFTRFAATVIDGLLFIPFYIPLFILTRKAAESGQEADSTLALINLLILLVGICFAFWNGIIRMGKTGQSLGKKFLGISVVDERGLPIGVGTAALREIIGKFVSGIVCYIGYLNAFWDDKKQGWHDKIAKSYVCYTPQNPLPPQ